jgi:hypothetical protein
MVDPFARRALIVFTRSRVTIVMPETPNGGKDAKFATLASIAANGDNWVKLSTLVLIGLSGLGNFFATQQTGHTVSEQTEKEIHSLYLEIDGFHNRQMQQLDSLRNIVETDNRQTEMNSKVLGNQENFMREFKAERENEIDEIHRTVKATQEKLNQISEDLKKPPGG